MPRSNDWTRLQQSLSDFGYLAHENVVEVTNNRNISPELIAAIAAAQNDSTGVVTVDDTIGIRDVGAYLGLADSLAGRFCGVPDQGGGIGPLTFGSPGGRWTRGVLKVSINATGCTFNNLPPPAASTNAVAVIMGAFGQWQAATNFFSLSFVPPGTGEDIRVIFGGASVDSRFGRPGGVLASAGYPQQGNLQFDSSETWNPDNLLGTALHEIGHLLGLSHSNTPGGTMYPYANNSATIDAESRNAIFTMYGWQPQQRIGDRGTSHRATLGVTSLSNLTGRSDTPQMVWKGVGDDSGIYYSEFRGSWTPQQRVDQVGCSHSPVLAEIGIAGSPTPATGLLMAWKGIPGDQGLYWTRNLGNGWEGQRRVSGVGSSAAPSLANVNGQVYMAWKGVENDAGIYWSTYDGAEGWAAQSKVAGVGTTDSPALVALNGVLYMFWKGVSGDANAYYSSYDVANDPIWKPQRRIEYFSYQTGGGVPMAIGTTGALSAAVRGNSILLAWKGVEGDSAIWYSLFANNEFSGQTTVPNVGTSVGPSVVQVGGNTYMAWKGIEGDSGIYWSRL
jgi:Matrixin